MNKQIRQQVFDKCNGRCAYCGCVLKSWQVDHIISQRNFQTHIVNKWKIPLFLSHLTIDDVNHIDNLFPACPSCNNWKSTFDLELFRNEIEQQIIRLNKRSSNYCMAKRFGLVRETQKSVVFYFETI